MALPSPKIRGAEQPADGREALRKFYVMPRKRRLGRIAGCLILNGMTGFLFWRTLS
jgi:hypothetical protein